ncbi:HD domain-containing protein [Curtobacterium flaccumfaciens pv. flaccumfaciens]|uniref:HD domain-containing protein n=1 Tax=Curtobacterium flaccumfaciens TaxID=2035 RepID=UPI00217D964F|nr:HD domain-containing protein [Curtobacterium flaccumfaciens]MCS6546658.1 HD domain-containing protein [Curtobacterium flaccumfaciens pv. flaccumfaciens]
MRPTTTTISSVRSCLRCGAERHDSTVHRCPGPGDPLRAFGLDAGARTVLEVLGGIGQPSLVGGAVRDLLLREAGRGPTTAGDVDVEVHGTRTDVVVGALRAAGAIVVEAGAGFPVLKVVLDGSRVDVAVTAESGALDPVTVSALGRDFTVNAVAWDPRTNVFLDAVGGIDDAVIGVLRHASERCSEDPLRVLRAVQLVARFDFAVHPATLRLARSLAARFESIATGRIWPEIRKLALGDHVSAALRTLHDSGWERHLPELAAVRDVPQDPRWHPEGPVHVHLGAAGDAAARACTADGIRGDDRVVIVLAAVLHDLGKAGSGTQVLADDAGAVRIRSLGHEVSGAAAAAALLGRLGAPRHIVERVVPLVREHMVPHSSNGAPPSVPAARRLFRRLGSSLPAMESWARVCEADSQGRGPGASRSSAWSWFDVALRDQVARRPVRLLSGRDLVDAGLTPGPVFRELLVASAAAQDDGVFDDVVGARAWLRRAVDARR